MFSVPHSFQFTSLKFMKCPFKTAFTSKKSSTIGLLGADHMLREILRCVRISAVDSRFAHAR